MSHYRRRMPATAISPHVKPTENNPKKYQAFNFVKSAEDNAFSTSAKRFSKDHYFLEDGGPGGNHLLNPQVVSQRTGDYSLRSDATGHGLPYEKSTVKGWGSPQDAVKGSRGWCGGAYPSSFAPAAVDPLLLKSSNLMKMAGNETRLQELAKLRESKFKTTPGPGTYNLAGGPITHKSFRRPESGGPKNLVEGRSLRSIETAPQFRTTSTIGPGYYDAASSKDKTQSRRLQQPVISNWKQGHTSKAECLSVTLLAGFHWKQKVPRLGEGDEQQQKPTGEDGQKPRPGWSPSPPPIVRTTMAPESYERYRQEQRTLDARLSQPKSIRTISPFVVPRIYSSPEESDYQSEYYSHPHSNDGWSRNTSPEGHGSHAFRGYAADDRGLVSPQERMGTNGGNVRAELPARAPSAPPEEVDDSEFDGARARGLHTERSARNQGSLYTLHENPEQIINVDTRRSEIRRREASRAATRALVTEQRRMDWHVRSSHGASWGPWENE